MALKAKLDSADIALYEILTDPIWCGEFLRSTSDGEPDRKSWPRLNNEPMKFNYRDYQRQFLSDKNEFILYTGGRAIGKCSPSSARVYTVEGYKKISELQHRSSFIVYALTPQMTLEQRRAKIVYNGLRPCYTFVTESGYEFAGTDNHPILTPEGYKQLHMLKPYDDVAVTTHLPYQSNNKALRWYELRMLGYLPLTEKWETIDPILPRYKAIAAELEFICDKMLINWHKDFEGNYYLMRKKGKFKSPIMSMFIDLGIHGTIKQIGLRRLPDILKTECLENIQVYLEAVFSQHATITRDTVSITVNTKELALDFQELLLRFGIETRIEHIMQQWKLSLLNYRALYIFYNTFKLPGVSVGKLPAPDKPQDEFMRFEKIVHIYKSHKITDTYAVSVYQDNNYISDNIFVHNSIVLEDKLVHEIINHDEEFPVTRESVLVTPNQAQMVPLQGKLIMRFTASKFLKDFLRNRINKSEGTMHFHIFDGKPHILHMRIAGSKGENNMVPHK